MDNLYRATIKSDEDVEDTFYVLARSSKPALSEAFKKYSKRHPDVEDKTLVELYLEEEDFVWTWDSQYAQHAQAQAQHPLQQSGCPQCTLNSLQPGSTFTWVYKYDSPGPPGQHTAMLTDFRNDSHPEYDGPPPVTPAATMADVKAHFDKLLSQGWDDCFDEPLHKLYTHFLAAYTGVSY